MNSPIAMISYSSKDCVAADLIQDELALRGFDVFRDQKSFTDGSRISTNMTTGVEGCNVFVAYLTPHSLYLNRPEGEARPALEREIRPALERRSQNLDAQGRSTPIFIPAAHGLGNRDEASRTFQSKTGVPINSLWTSQWLDQNTPHITQPEAAALADQALRALLEQEPAQPPIETYIATRSAPPEPLRFTVDGTRLLGGDRRPGDPDSWLRFHAGLRSLVELFESHCAGAVSVHLACHLSAAFAAGRMFHQASRWSPCFITKSCRVAPTTQEENSDLQGNPDLYSEHGDLLVNVDLIGHDVARSSSDLASLLSLGGRLSLSRTSTHQMSPMEIAVAARCTATKVRSVHADLRPKNIHLTMAAPAGFAALLGHHLTSLEADIVTYEFADYKYHRALVIPSASP